MPYIEKRKREFLDSNIDKVIESLKGSSPDELNGDLNYIITRILAGTMNGKIRYNKINNLIGVLECAKQELYRRCSFYEDMKMSENGDVREYIDIGVPLPSPNNDDVFKVNVIKHRESVNPVRVARLNFGFIDY